MGKFKNKNYKLQNTNYKQITKYNVQKYKKSGARRANWLMVNGEL